MQSKAHMARLKESARLFGLVASHSRLAIIALLEKKGETPVLDIAKQLGMSQSAVSHQLALLSRAGIVASKKDGRIIRYRISARPEARSLVKLLKAAGL